MAKSDVLKVVEKHIEKLVLAVCIVMMVLACWRWLASSPTELRVVRASGRGMASASPTEVDDTLKKAADNTLRMYTESDKAEAAKIPQDVPLWVPRLANAYRMPPLPIDGTHLTLPGMPLAPDTVDSNDGGTVRLADLIAAMPPPAKPVVTATVESPRRDPVEDVVVAKGIASYPLEQLLSAWKKMLPATVSLEAVVPHQVIVEVQQAPADGDWSKAKITRVATPPLVAEDGNAIVTEIPDFDGNNTREVREAILMVFAAQKSILRWSYPEVYRVDGWKTLTELNPPSTRIVFFDDSTMKLGGTYRYRTQLVLVSPVLTHGRDVRLANPDDEKVKFLTSKPSEWSAPVTARREVHFFLDGANPLSQKLAVMVYARHWGQWVKQKFDAQVGEVVGGTKKVQLWDPVAKAMRSMEVDFSTGSVVLRLDFNKVLDRRGVPLRTQELLYADPDGKLRSRIMAFDKDNEKRKALDEMIRRQSEAAVR